LKTNAIVMTLNFRHQQLLPELPPRRNNRIDRHDDFRHFCDARRRNLSAHRSGQLCMQFDSPNAGIRLDVRWREVVRSENDGRTRMEGTRTPTLRASCTRVAMRPPRDVRSNAWTG
jgi:hypothetical protein